MNALLFLTLLLLLLVLSAAFSGSETGVYSLSRMRLEAEASSGRKTARLLRALVRQDTTLLVTLLVGNNLMLELATQLVQGRLDAIDLLPDGARELAITLFLTPLVFVFGELLPKDLFRRRPHQLLAFLLPLLLASRVLLLPLVVPLVLLSRVLERVFRLRETELQRALRREEVLDVLALGSREGALPAQAAELARNVLVLRQTPVARVLVPWKRVETVSLDDAPAALYESVRRARFTRLPALAAGAEGVLEVRGYLHQLDVLSAGESGQGPPEAGASPIASARDPGAQLRPLPMLPPDLPVERALKRMRTSGQRVAVVGSPEKPLGLVSLMDLLATISGDPAR